MINACELSKYVILKAAISGKSITHLKLQKILYYLQGEHFKAFGRPLFPERIEDVIRTACSGVFLQSDIIKLSCLQIDKCN